VLIVQHGTLFACDILLQAVELAQFERAGALIKLMPFLFYLVSLGLSSDLIGFYSLPEENAMTEPNGSKENDRSESSEETQKKAKIVKEEAKDRHTSHWDIDYMTTEEIEEAHRQGES